MSINLGPNFTSIVGSTIPSANPLRRLVILPNCNADLRCSSWLGALNGETRRGCGINVLRFMNEIDDINALHGLDRAINSGQGTPFSDIVDWFNKKLTNSRQSIDADGNTFFIYEQTIRINSKVLLEEYFKQLDYNLPINSCTIVKLNRHPDPAQRPANLTPGHYVLMSKDGSGKLWTYEPYISTPTNCVKREYKGVSDKFYNAYQSQGYITVSILMTQATPASPRPASPRPVPPIPTAPRPAASRPAPRPSSPRPVPEEQTPMEIGGGKINSVFLMPKNTLGNLINDINNSIECKNNKLSKRSKQTRRRKTTKRRKTSTSKEKRKYYTVY